MPAALRRRRLPALAKFVIETMRDGLAVHDREGRLLGWNPGAGALTGWSAAEAQERFPAGLPLGETVVTLAGRQVAMRRFDFSDRGEDWIVSLFSGTAAGEPARGAAPRPAASGLAAPGLAAPGEPHVEAPPGGSPQDQASKSEGGPAELVHRPGPALAAPRRAPAARRAPGELGLLDAAGVMLVVLDTEGRILSSNRACQAASERSAAELAGQPLWETLVAPDQAGMGWAALDRAASGGWARLDCALLTRDGTRRFVSWSIGALPGPGEPRRLVAAGIDVTHRQLAEEALAATVADLDQQIRALHRRARRAADNISDTLSAARPGALGALAGRSGMVQDEPSNAGRRAISP